MNYSIYSADRTTHLEIVVMALVTIIGLTSLGIAAHFEEGDQSSGMVQTIKAAKPSVSLAAVSPAELTFIKSSPGLPDTQIQ